MKTVTALRCDFCKTTLEDPDAARVHEEACKAKAEQEQSQKEIRGQWEELKRRCTHPKRHSTRIQDMPGMNFHISCPDCGYADDEYDQSR